MTINEINSLPKINGKDIYISERAESLVDNAKCIILPHAIALYKVDPSENIYICNDDDDCEIVVICGQKNHHIPYMSGRSKVAPLHMYMARKIDREIIRQAALAVMFAEEMGWWK